MDQTTKAPRRAGWAEQATHGLARVAGTPTPIAVATVLFVATGLATGWSEAWERLSGLVGAFFTLVLVFVLQRAQNKEFRAMQVKLDELLEAVEGAHGHLVAAEERSEEEIAHLRDADDDAP